MSMSQFSFNLHFSACCQNNISIRCVIEKSANGCSPSVDCWFISVLDQVNIIKENKLRSAVDASSMNPTLIVSD